MARTHVPLRDFLYLDAERVRSLLAQLEGGVVERVAERLTKSHEARAGASIFRLLDLGGSLLREKSSEQTKSLQDALFLLFEEAAQEAQLISQPAEIHDPEAWARDDIHQALRPAELIQVRAPSRILDSRHFRERAERFARWPRLVTSFAHHEDLAKLRNPKEREKRLANLVAQSMGGEVDVEMIKDLGEFVDLFMASAVALRQFPCGLDYPQFALVGMLLDRPGFLQEEREALFAKYGSAPTEWTVVSQVASIPRDTYEAPEDLDATGLVDEASGQISREKFEELSIAMMRVMEATGVAESPTYPSISITPLAVYREVPKP